MGVPSVTNPVLASDVEKVLVGGDLSKLSPEQRVAYYNAVCQSLSLNPLTKPFAYIQLNGKLVLYALKDCTEQLRNQHAISLSLPSRESIEGVYVVTASAVRPDGRRDEATGAVPIENLKGEARANAMMKAETKAKRRVTLSICGLGMLDESEVESIPDARRVDTEGIDTGGHAIGTQAAADHVRDTKLKALPAGGAHAHVEDSGSARPETVAPAHIPPVATAGAQQNRGQAEQPAGGSQAVQAEAAALSEDVPLELRPIFASLGKSGYARQGLELMKARLVQVMPPYGETEYRRICEKHDLKPGGGMKVASVKLALLEMYHLAENFKLHNEAMDQRSDITDADVPLLKEGTHA